MLVTIAGMPGSGKSTVAKKLKEKLFSIKKKEFSLIDVGIMRREVALTKGMTIQEFNEWSKSNPEQGDEFFDNYVKKKVQQIKNAIIIGRMSFFILPHSLKVFIDVDWKIGAKRIFLQKSSGSDRNEDEVLSLESQILKNKERVDQDIERYEKVYNINPYDQKHFDLIIDSSDKTIDQVVDIFIQRMYPKFNNDFFNV
jgi:CMP/dCMP kinase